MSDLSTTSGWTFAQVHCNVIMDARLTNGAMRLYCYLVWRQGNHDSCWPSIARIAQDLGVTDITAHRHVEELEGLGYIAVERNNGHSNHYTIVAETPIKIDTTTPIKIDTQNDNHMNDTIRTDPKKRDRCRTPIPPEIVWVHETIGQYIIAKQAYPLVIPVIQGKRDPDLLKQCSAAWAAKGYKPTNLAWLLDWYAKGVIPNGGAPPRRNEGNGDYLAAVCVNCFENPCACKVQ